jgi:hypothetical protein
VLNDVSIANCRSGLLRIPAVYRTQRPIASTYPAFFRTLLKRYVARELYPLLQAITTATTIEQPHPNPADSHP